MPVTSRRAAITVSQADASATFDSLPLVEWREGPDGPPTVRIFVVAVATDGSGARRRFVHPLAFSPRPASTIVRAARIHDWDKGGTGTPVDLYADPSGGVYRAAVEPPCVDGRRQSSARAEIFALYLLGPEFSPAQLGWTLRPVLKGLRVVNARMARAEGLPSLEGLAASGFEAVSTNAPDLEAAVRQAARNSFAWTGTDVARSCMCPCWNVVCTVGGRIAITCGVGQPVSSGNWSAGASFGLGEYPRALEFGRTLEAAIPGGKLTIKAQADVHDTDSIRFNGEFRTAEAMANPLRFALRKVEPRFVGSYAEGRISAHLSLKARIGSGEEARAWWSAWAELSAALPRDLPPDDVSLRRLLILRAVLDGCGYAPAGVTLETDPTGGPAHRIRMSCLHVLNELVPYLNKGGAEYQERWSGVMRANTAFGDTGAEAEAQRLAGAMFQLWLAAPAAFPPDDGAVLAWARTIRPRMEDVVTAANDFEAETEVRRVPEPEAVPDVRDTPPEPTPPAVVGNRRPRMTATGRAIHDALQGKPPMRRVDIAELVGIGRGSVNRTVPRLVGEGWLVEEPGGLFRRAPD